MNLIEATCQQDVVSVKEMLSQGADPNFVEDDANVTALHIAAQQNQFNIADALLRAGANPCVYTSEGHSPLFIALLHQHVEVILLLAAYMEKRLIPSFSN